MACLAAQTLAPSRIVVVVDNCTDETAEVALACGAQVVRTFNNQDKKAGALNQALNLLDADLASDELILVMDADSMIIPTFLETAVSHLRRDPHLGAVGGVFYGEAGAGLVGALQRNEYARYARDIGRRKGKAQVLTGTASVFRMSVLRRISAARGITLPGRPGTIYDVTALTEDNEMTLAVKSLGSTVLSPRSCAVLTEIMPTWTALWHQRLRWQRGALENLRSYGLNRTTAPYVVRQVGMYLGILAVALFMAFTVITVSLGVFALPHGWWLILPAIFIAERSWTVRLQGWRSFAIAAPLVFEFGYDLFQQAVFIRAAVDTGFNHEATWHHHVPVSK